MLEELNAHEDEVDQELLRVLPHVVTEVAENIMRENFGKKCDQTRVMSFRKYPSSMLHLWQC